MRLCVVVCLSFAASACALDYFGDIAANELVLDIGQVVYSPETRPKAEFGYRIELVNGTPVLSRTSPATGTPTPGTMEIMRLATVDGKSVVTGEKAELVFTFTTGGWNEDKGKTIFRIPYTVLNDDPKGMLNIGTTGTMENQFWDPKNKNVAVTTGQCFPVACKTVKSTLGFGNKVESK